jgi:hypothetical protein
VSRHPPRHLAPQPWRARAVACSPPPPQPTQLPASKQARKSTRHGRSERTWRSEQEARRQGNQNAIGGREGGREGTSSAVLQRGLRTEEEDPRRDPGRGSAPDTCARAPLGEGDEERSGGNAWKITSCRRRAFACANVLVLVFLASFLCVAGCRGAERTTVKFPSTLDWTGWFSLAFASKTVLFVAAKTR